MKTISTFFAQSSPQISNSHKNANTPFSNALTNLIDLVMMQIKSIQAITFWYLILTCFLSGVLSREEGFSGSLRGGGNASPLDKELAWAEHTMELYKRKNKKMPLRSSIRGAHVHTEDWVQESLDILNSQD